MSNRFMTRSSDKKSIIRALKGEDLPTTPVWLMRQAGRYLPEYREIRGNVSGFLELCYTPELAVEVTLQPIRRYGLDAAILFSDILVIPDALGQSVRFLEGEGPKLDPVRDVAGIEALSEDGLHEHLAPVYETLRGLTVELPPDVTLIGFAGAPWTVATYMVEGGGSRDFAITRKWGLLDPKGFSRLIDLVTRATTAYLCRQVEEGAEVLQIFDSWAGVLSEGEFDDWVIGPTIRIVSAVKARHPGIPDAVSLDSTVPVDWAARRLQDKVALQGNLDPLLLLGGGEVMDREIHRILKSLGSGPFIFNLGHGIIKETSPDNVARLVEVVRGG
jgi:uroporphyrinogen decarboxylase